ncbi:hypothetical protein ANN_01678 [Periplaneta americana]|uniref:Ionotropic glutamate receptor C-terminal domain-containing protein n=1 Tax=Periplaneta americana TaxID=6978 RepID=A0ABQ8TWL9_PERAM|nr:hypothetical protein ANN_01678 [Periplaneta americana]
MKQPDMYVVSLIADFFLCRHTTQVTLLVCWGLGKHSFMCALSLNVFHNRGIYWLFLNYDKWKVGHFIPFTSGQHFYNFTTPTITIASLECFPRIPLIRVKSVYQFHTSSYQSKEIAGHWSPQRGLKLRHSVFKPNEIYDLEGAVLNVTAVSPFAAQQSHQMYDWTLLQLLMETLDFRLQVVESRSRYRKSTDLWLLQQLMSGRVDIGASSILVTHDRVGLAEYTMAIEKFRPTLYYKVQSVRAARNIYVLPFSVGVWASLCSLLLAITVALTFILRRESQLPKREFGLLVTTTGTGDKLVQPKWELSEVLLVTVGAVCQQGSARNPTTSAARTMFIVLFVLAVLTYTAYSASVISLLSSPSSVTSTLQGILRHGSKMGLALLNIHYYHSHFKGEVAFCADKVDAHTYLHSSHQTEVALCSVGEIPLLQGPEYQRAFALPVSSPYTRAINYGLMRLIQFGLMQRERQRWFQVRPLCDTPEPPAGTSFISIALDDIYPVLYLIAFGFICAYALLPLECIVHYCMKLYARKYKDKQSPRHKWIRRQKVMRMMCTTPRQRARAMWWVSRAWQRFRRGLSNAPLPFVH